MIIELYALKCFFLGVVISAFTMLKWRKYNTCTGYLIKEFRCENSISLPVPTKKLKTLSSFIPFHSNTKFPTNLK